VDFGPCCCCFSPAVSGNQRGTREKSPETFVFCCCLWCWRWPQQINCSNCWPTWPQQGRKSASQFLAAADRGAARRCNSFQTIPLWLMLSQVLIRSVRYARPPTDEPQPILQQTLINRLERTHSNKSCQSDEDGSCRPKMDQLDPLDESD
jgi:hypothetical protein